jgi:hypothetical protein
VQVVISNHAARRLHDARQTGITVADLIQAAKKIPGVVPAATRFRGCSAMSGRQFDFVIKDVNNTRLVVTIIGK